MISRSLSRSLLILALALGGWGAARLEAAPSDHRRIKIIQTSELSFPFTLTNTQVMSGNATIAIDVDQNGKLVEWLVTGYSRKEFADSAAAALQHWEFEPPRVNGTPWSSVNEVTFNFSRSGVVVSMLSHEMINATIDRMHEGTYAFRTYKLSELDRIPTPIHVVSPSSPAGSPTGRAHQVTVEFYIDQKGEVRMPSVSEQQVGDQRAGSAIDAVRQWRFEPPVCKGQPVLVLARQQFDFLPAAAGTKRK